MSMQCSARQFSDQMMCGRGLVWDVNDPEPPKCYVAGGCDKAKANIPRPDNIIPPFDHEAEQHVPAAMPDVNMPTPQRVRHASIEALRYHRDVGIDHHPHSGIAMGLYRTDNGYVTVETNRNLKCADNLVYTYLSSTGSRSHQVISFAGGERMVRYPTRYEWGHWFNLKQGEVK